MGSGQSWVRLIILAFLVSGLALLAQAHGSLTPDAVPFVAALFSLAFIIGVFAAWMEAGSMSKRLVRVLHAADSGLGPWDVIARMKRLKPAPAATVFGWSWLPSET